MNASYTYLCIHPCLSQKDFLRPNKHAFINLAKDDTIFSYILTCYQKITEPSQIFASYLTHLLLGTVDYSSNFFSFDEYHQENFTTVHLGLIFDKKFLFEIRWQTRQRQLHLLSWYMTKPHQHHLQNP